MREIIAGILPYEGYIWILTGVLTLGWGIYFILQWLANRTKHMTQEEVSEENEVETIVLDLNNEGKEGKKDSEEANSTEDIDYEDLKQKLLQHMDVENEEHIESIDRIEEQERVFEKNNNLEVDEIQIVVMENTDDEVIILEEVEKTSNGDQNAKQEKNKVFSTDTIESLKKETPETIMITPEIYNTNTNIETINKQKSQFETLKAEIHHLEKRGLDVEYEKKLIEATIDFPDDEYFNTLLGDYYIDHKDFKKAQTIYKKLHLQDSLNDAALFKLGIINLELGDMQAAEFLLSKAKDLKPENPKYYQVLAEAKYSLEKIDECVELMEKAVDLRPTKFEYIEILGKLYKETNNVQLYYKTLLKMNAIEPQNFKVKSELNKFQEGNY